MGIEQKIDNEVVKLAIMQIKLDGVKILLAIIYEIYGNLLYDKIKYLAKSLRSFICSLKLMILFRPFSFFFYITKKKQGAEVFFVLFIYVILLVFFL